MRVRVTERLQRLAVMPKTLTRVSRDVEANKAARFNRIPSPASTYVYLVIAPLVSFLKLLGSSLDGRVFVPKRGLARAPWG